MSSVTFCAEAPQLRNILGFIVGIPFGVAGGSRDACLWMSYR
jgi:hypothetical protein